MTFLPSDYTPPQASGGKYFKPQKDTTTKIRILSDAIVGWEYWTTDNKPKRLREMPSERPADMRTGDNDKIKHFWAVLIWDYADSALKVWEITQGTVRDALSDFASDEDWGHPKLYDIKVSKSGSGLETKYGITPIPAKELGDEVKVVWADATIDLEELFRGGDVFAPSIIVDGAAGSYTENRAVRTLNDLVQRSGGDSEKLQKVTDWGMKHIQEIVPYAGDLDKAKIYVNGVTQGQEAFVSAAGSEIPF